MLSLLISMVMALWRLAQFSAMFLSRRSMGHQALRYAAISLLAILPFLIGTVPFIFYFEADQSDNLRQLGFDGNVEYDQAH